MFGINLFNITIETIKGVINPINLFIIAVITWGILIVPESIIKLSGLYVMRNQYKAYIGIVALITSLWLIALVGLHIKNLFAKNRYIKNTINNLLPIEKACLVLFIDNDTPTVSFYTTDGVPMGLYKRGILYRTSSTYRLRADFNINPDYYSFLKKNKQLLEQGRDEKILEEAKEKTRFSW